MVQIRVHCPKCQTPYSVDESYMGKDVTQDHKEAFKWFRKAAELGFARGQHSLGVCYERGFGVGKNINEAVKWYREATKQGDPQAPEDLKRLGITS